MASPTMDRLLLPGFTPQSGADSRAKALAMVEMATLPNHKAEEYKYTPLTSLGEVAWVEGIGTGLSIENADALSLPGVAQTRFVFVNGFFDPELSDSVPAGVEFLPIEVALQQGLTEGKFGTLANLDAETFKVAAHLGQLSKPPVPFTAALNAACFQSGAFLKITKNAQVEKPIHLVFVSAGALATSCPRTLIVAESGSQATVIESYVSAAEDATLTVPVTEIFVYPNATLEHIRLENENLVAKNIGLVEVRQEADSNYRSYNIVFGSALTRNDINIFIDGSNSHTRFDGIVAIGGEQHVDNHTRLDHVKPHCESFEIYKHLLSDKSRAVFNGKIFVHQDAQKTDAKQTNMTLLLSREAQVDTKPQLEIFADDVKCTHGATIGQLRKDAMFYMNSRGINPVKAQALLVYAFAAEVLELIENDELRAALESLLFAKLGTERN